MLLGEIFGHPEKPQVLYSGNYIKSPTYVGVELEFCNMGRAPQDLRYWRWAYDGSLRGDRPGELVLRAPTPASLFDNAIKEYICNVQGEVSINSSCAMHVHIDVCDLTLEELRGVLLLYSVLERTIYRYCGVSRKHNNFCVPMWECGDRLSWINRSIGVGEDIRYCGLNLAAVRKFGSIEFRMHPGVTFARAISDWAGLCASIKEYGKSCNVDALYNLLQNNSANDFLTTTLKDYAGLLTLYCSKEDLLEGARDGKEIYFSSSLRGVDTRLSRTSSSRRAKSLYVPYDRWLLANQQGEV